MSKQKLDFINELVAKKERFVKFCEQQSWEAVFELELIKEARDKYVAEMGEDGDGNDNTRAE